MRSTYIFIVLIVWSVRCSASSSSPSSSLTSPSTTSSSNTTTTASATPTSSSTLSSTQESSTTESVTPILNTTNTDSDPLTTGAGNTTITDDISTISMTTSSGDVSTNSSTSVSNQITSPTTESKSTTENATTTDYYSSVSSMNTTGVLTSTTTTTTQTISTETSDTTTNITIQNDTTTIEIPTTTKNAASSSEGTSVSSSTNTETETSTSIESSISNSATTTTTSTTSDTANSSSENSPSSTGSTTTTVPGSTSDTPGASLTTVTTDEGTSSEASITTSNTPHLPVTTDESTSSEAPVPSNTSLVTTTDENTTSGDQPTTKSNPLSSDSPSTSQTKTTITTTPRPPTTTIGIYGNYTIDTENAFLTVPINVMFLKCVEKDVAQANITNALSKIGMTVLRVKSFPCNETTKIQKRSEHTGAIFVEANVRAKDFIGNDTVQSAIYLTITTAFNIKVFVDWEGASDLTMCDTDVCRQASLKYKGFTCESGNDSDSGCVFKSKCFGKNCGYGECEVKANGSHYYSVCKCQEEDMYKYTVSADKCVKGDLAYKAWMIIAAGAGGLIILILLFAIVIQCARRKREPLNPDKYAYDVGYSDRETLMHGRSYDHIDQYHRKPSLKIEDRRIQTSLQTFDNQGYDHWDPDESKETYQSIDRHFQNPNFQTQITRPKLTTNRYGEDKLTPF